MGCGRRGGRAYVKIEESAVSPVHDGFRSVGPLHQDLVHLSVGRKEP